MIFLHILNISQYLPTHVYSVFYLSIILLSGARGVFLNADVEGCSFHHAQAMLNKIDTLGLRNAFRENGRVQDYLRMFFALPYLPAEHIRPAFDRLAVMATDKLIPFVDYVRDYWLGEWDPQDWCAFMKFVRTNNDVEGWHTRFNRSGGNNCHNLELYVLIPLMHVEALKVPLTSKLVEEDKLQRITRSATKARNELLTSCWDRLAKASEEAQRTGQMPSYTTCMFLKEVRKSTAPANA